MSVPNDPSGSALQPTPPDGNWYTEHTALLISTFKWTLLGAGAGLCVGLATRGFLWVLRAVAVPLAALPRAGVQVYWLLPLALPLCVWLIRTFASEARGHGTEAVIAAVHQRSGRIDWLIAPVKLLATVLTLSCGGSVGKEGPAAQIGAALTSLCADLLRLNERDRRNLVICGISAGFAAVFGTPVSGALFGLEVLYLGSLEYALIFPALVAGIVAHLVCGQHPPVTVLPQSMATLSQLRLVLVSLLSGLVFGLIALLLIETLRVFERLLRRWRAHPYWLALLGGVALIGLYTLAGERYAGLGTDSIEAVLAGTLMLGSSAFLIKILATTMTLETGGSGGILTPIFFIGATAGAALAPWLGVAPAMLAAFGFFAVLAAAANTPVAATVMAIEVLPSSIGVYAALAAVTAYLMVGHRSVYGSQKLGLSKSAGLEVPLGLAIGAVDRSQLRIRKGSLTEQVHRLGRRGDE
ncbi:MAG: chloride channel protein [Steroidobacteraceae bacterium]